MSHNSEAGNGVSTEEAGNSVSTTVKLVMVTPLQ